MKKILFFFCVFLMTQLSHSQLVNEDFTSRVLGGKRKIVIYLPEKYSEKEAYPLIVVLNAGSLMEPVISSARYFQYFDAMPKSIIVGVYTEADDIEPEQESQISPKTVSYLNFIGGEIVPYIQGKYAISSFRGIVASEETGFVAMHFLSGEKPLFNAVISLNPNVEKYLYESDNQLLRNIKSQTFFYIGTSDKNYKTDYQNSIELDTALKSNGISENITYYFEDFKGSSAQSVVLTGLARSLDLLFDSYKPITRKDFEDKILPMGSDFTSYLSEKYSKIEKELNIKKKLTLNDIMAIYEAIKLKEDWNSLLQLSDYVKDNGYNKTAMPNFFLGEFYENTDDKKRAFKAYQKAYSEQSIDFITRNLINERLEKVKK